MQGKVSKAPGGFTLIEVMLALAVLGILLGVSAWQMQRFIVGSRATAAARELVTRLGQARAIAARTNQPIELVFTNAGTGCVPRYEIRNSGGTVYDTVCFGSEYPGVALSAGTVTDEVGCTDESDAVPNCSLCSGTKTLTFFPSGEVDASASGASGDSIVFSVPGDVAARTVAVGIRNLNGRTRIYRPNSTEDGWVCR